MKLLLDECLPKKLKSLFSAGGHQCETVRDAGFGSKTNGGLLALAENNFDVLITIDQNLRYQQNMTGRKLSVVVLCAPSNDLDDLRPLIPAALTALRSIEPGQIVEVR